MTNVILIDNRDSFTFNLVYALEALGAAVTVYRNNTPLNFLLDQAATSKAAFVISPGPGSPANAGVSLELVRAAAARFGVLGICLGHQVIIEAFGGYVNRAPEIVHGRASNIHCNDHALFRGMPNSFPAARYHSLSATTLPVSLREIAATATGVTMAVVHRTCRIAGLQFHPESILTPHGARLLRNALEWLGNQNTREHDHATIT